MNDKPIVYNNVKNFLDRIDEKSYQIEFGGYYIKKGIETVKQYETHINNNLPFKKSNNVYFIVERLYTMVTGKRFRRKAIMVENNRELLANLTNSAVLLLLMSNFNVRFANAFTDYSEIPHIPTATSGVDEVLELWQDFDFPQYIYRYANNVLRFSDKMLYSPAIRNKFMREDYGVLKLLLAAQFSEIRWADDKKIAVVKDIFNNITLQDGTIDVKTLTKILQFFTRHNNIIDQNVDYLNLVKQQKTIIKGFANIKILEQVKTMPASMLDSIVMANINKK